MNSAQRRTTYRRLRKLMRDKTPVAAWLYSRTKGRTRGVVIDQLEGYGLGFVLTKTGAVESVAARYIEPLPRCKQVTL